MNIINRLEKIIKQPMTLLVTWAAFLLSPLLTVLRIEYIKGNINLNFSIHGMSTVLLYLPLFLSFLAFVIFTSWYDDFLKSKLRKAQYVVIFLITIASLMFILSSAKLINLEKTFYPNYVYEHYGIILTHLSIMSFIAGYQIITSLILIINKLSNLTSSNTSKSIYDKNIGLFKNRYIIKPYVSGTFRGKTSFFLCVVGFLTLIMAAFYPFINWSKLVVESHESYEAKVGSRHKYLDALATDAPEDSTIIHPPQGDNWPAIGNQPLIRFFLFPRPLVSGALFVDQEFAGQFESAYFTKIIDKVSWPIIDLTRKVIVFDETTEIFYKSLSVSSMSNGVEINKITF